MYYTMMARIIIWSSLLLLPLFGLAQWSQPGDRYAYEFDGSSSIIQLANESLFDAASSVVVELDVWFDDVTSSGYKGIVAKRDGVSSVTNFAINYQGSTNQFQWYFNNGSGFSVHVLDLRTYFAIDTWYHVRLSFVENGSNVDSEIIIDGGTPITTTFTGKSLGSNNVPVTIGNSFVGSTQWHPGKVDNLKITIDGKTTAYYLFEDGTGSTLTDRLGNSTGTISGGSWYNKWTPPATLPTDYWAYYFAENVDGDGNSANNSGTYTTWVDLSGNGFDLDDIGIGASYSSNSLNGYGGLNFGSCDYAYHNSPGGTLTEISIAFVIKITDYQAGALLPIAGVYNNDGSQSAWIEGDFNNGEIFWNVDSDTGTSTPVLFSGSPGNGTIIVAVGTLNYSTGECYLETQNGNNELDTVARSGSDLDMSGGAYISLEPCSGDSYDYLEVQMFDRVLTLEEVDLLMSHLTTKYGL